MERRADHFPGPFILACAVVFVASLSRTATAQNLVVNPGFEDSLQCPSGSGAFTNYVAVWTKPTYASSDYFYAGCPVAPVNEPPHAGNAYAGIIVYDPANYREYVTGTLTAPLLAGETYEVSFFVSLLDNCIDGISELGAWFTPASPSISNANPILLTPQYQHASPLIIDNGWKEVKGYFQAAGGEQYITIGSFVPDSQLTFTTAPGTNSWFDVYYFIDDVYVARDSVTGTGTFQSSPPATAFVYPNPASGLFKAEVHIDGQIELVISDISGRDILSMPFFGTTEIDCSSWPDGLMFYQFRQDGRSITRGRLVVHNGR